MLGLWDVCAVATVSAEFPAYPPLGFARGALTCDGTFEGLDAVALARFVSTLAL